jgi:hypothetical protein
VSENALNLGLSALPGKQRRQGINIFRDNVGAFRFGVIQGQFVHTVFHFKDLLYGLRSQIQDAESQG